jgi:hypothetical protein
MAGSSGVTGRGSRGHDIATPGHRTVLKAMCHLDMHSPALCACIVDPVAPNCAV